MKKVIYATDLCCERCAKHVAEKLLFLDGVEKAKANYKKNCIYVELLSSASEEEIRETLAAMDIEVTSIELRRGLFG